MLFESPLPFMRLSLWVVLPTVVTITALFLGAMYYGLKIRHKKPVSGMEGLIDEIGVANTDIANEGKVFIDGEYWDAWSDEQIKEGEKVKVLDVKGLKLKVVRI